MSRTISFTCSKCGVSEFNIDLDDPNWFTGGSLFCGNCGAGLNPGADHLDADFFWKNLKNLAKKSRGKNREAIQNALNGIVEYLSDYSVLEKDEWVELLLKRPALAGKCPLNLFASKDWERLLAKRPELASHCDWKSLSFSSELWTSFLLKGTALDAHCPWDVITSGDWVKLLIERPDLDAHCSWDVITSGDWEKLLAKRPELASH